MISASVRRHLGAGLTAFPLTLALLATTAAPMSSHGTGPGVVMVDVVDFAYQPQTITIHVGDTIQWNNADDVDHTATSVDGAPAAFDVYLAAGAWGSFTFVTPGTYDYFCIPHPTMTATVIVEPVHAETGDDEVPNVAMPAPSSGPIAAAAILAALGILLGAVTAVVRRRRAGP